MGHGGVLHLALPFPDLGGSIRAVKGAAQEDLLADRLIADVVFEPTSDEPVKLPAPARIAMLACVVLVGIFHGPFVKMATLGF